LTQRFFCDSAKGGAAPTPARAARPVADARGRAQDTAKLIADGKVVAWFQGRSEAGPRALGHRSILADPVRRPRRLSARAAQRAGARAA